MAFKVLKRDVATMSQAQLLLNFELCVIEMTKEVNFSKTRTRGGGLRDKYRFSALV